ncbi:hypothetical protein N0V88_004438 [Collariella sp. IMI 366227]|nr:hypothetical protein N0V88_004438 [Collariella sp. IMI 366227]
MSIARAFTTRRVKHSLHAAEQQDHGPHRSNSTTLKSSFGSIRHKISSPVQLIHTTNMLSYSAPDIHPISASSTNSSPRSDDDMSDSALTTGTSPPTSPDIESPKRSLSPEPNHLSCFFTVSELAEEFAITTAAVGTDPSATSLSITTQSIVDNAEERLMAARGLVKSSGQGKKRKAYRQRPEDPETSARDSEMPQPDHLASSITPAASSAQEQHQQEEEGLSVSEVIRIRNARKHKHGGVGFRAGPVEWGASEEQQQQNTEQSLVLHGSADAMLAADSAVVGGISKRFAPQTGLVGEVVNKHIRKRHAAEAAAQQQQQQEQEDQARRDSTTSTSNAPIPTATGDSQRVLHGRLLEIDLGEEARARNVEMTERARRRLQGQIDEEEHDESRGGRPGKVRLGRDGKPMRPRNRRGSDAIKRDQLVEEFLSENRPKTDNPQLTSTTSSTFQDDAAPEAADDRIAEEFRREFMEAMAQKTRRGRRAAQPAGGSAKQQQEEILRGPKLGGSRNERAAMRDLLLKEQVSRGRGGGEA